MFVLLDYKLKKLRNYFGRESHTNLYFRQYALISVWRRKHACACINVWGKDGDRVVKVGVSKI